MEASFLANLEPAQREHLLDRSVRRRFRRRQPLFHYGDPSDGMHLIRSGRVMIQISTPAGEEACLTVAGPGECIGEQSLLVEGGRRSASAIALEAAETLFCPGRRFSPCGGMTLSWIGSWSAS